MAFQPNAFQGGGIQAPTVSNLTPSENVEAGAVGGFSAIFSVARLTPIEFDIEDISFGGEITISVRYENRNESYVARNAEGVWVWPFDIEPDNSIGDLESEPVHVTLLPRGGWPPTRIGLMVAVAKKAEGIE